MNTVRKGNKLNFCWPQITSHAQGNWNISWLYAPTSLPGICAFMLDLSPLLI